LTLESKLAKAKSENPEVAVAEAKTSLTHLQAAQLITSVFRLRESLAAKSKSRKRRWPPRHPTQRAKGG